MKKHIVCFGDSNTHGYCADPRDSEGGGGRYSENERWPQLLAAALNQDCLVIEEGLSGRTTVFPDPLYEGLDGLSVLCPILMSHKPLDLLLIMLGTNDCKERFAASAECIALGMERLIRKAAQIDCWAAAGPRILLVAPVPMEEGMLRTEEASSMGDDAIAKSRRLAGLYRALAERCGCHFWDAAGCELSPADAMHLSRRGHRQLAEGLLRILPDILA